MKEIRGVLFALIITFGCASVVMSDTRTYGAQYLVDLARQAHERGDYERAITEYKRTRSRISSAALFVKVTASRECGATP